MIASRKLPSHILFAQTLDHFIVLASAALILFVGLKNLGGSSESWLWSANFVFAGSILGLVFFISILYRVFCLFLLGKTLGAYLFNLSYKSPLSTQFWLGHVWESTHLIVPLFWAIEVISRHKQIRLGQDYIFCYKRSL